MKKVLFLFILFQTLISVASDEIRNISHTDIKAFYNALRDKDIDALSTVLENTSYKKEDGKIESPLVFLEFEGWQYNSLPLFLAETPEVVRLLLEYGADPNARYGSRGETALFLKDNPAIVELLLEYGTDPNIQDIHGNTALYNKVLESKFNFNQGLKENITLLLQYGADVSMKNNEGFSALDLDDTGFDAEGERYHTLPIAIVMLLEEYKSPEYYKLEDSLRNTVFKDLFQRYLKAEYHMYDIELSPEQRDMLQQNIREVLREFLQINPFYKNYVSDSFL